MASVIIAEQTTMLKWMTRETARLSRADAISLVEETYLKILLRPADPNGLSHWSERLANEGPEVFGQFIDSLLRSDEFGGRTRDFLQTYVAPNTIEFVNDNSQNGEISLLTKHLLNEAVTHRVVVDVGAYGRAGSNSYDLMRHLGWTGILIEANPRLLPKIESEFAGCDYKLLNFAVSDEAGTATLHLGVHDEISSIHRTMTEHWGPVHDTIEVETRRLSDLLAEHEVPLNFGLLSVDAEGEGLNILEDAIANGYRPTWMIFEVYEGLKIGSLNELPLSEAIRDGYEIVIRTYSNLIVRAR